MEFFGKKRPNFGCFWPKKGQFGIFDKKAKRTFFTFINPRPHEKNQKNLMRQFENMSKKNTDFGLFWPKMANFGPILTKKGPILNFRQKNKMAIFLRL